MNNIIGGGCDGNCVGCSVNCRYPDCDLYWEEVRITPEQQAAWDAAIEADAEAQYDAWIEHLDALDEVPF